MKKLIISALAALCVCGVQAKTLTPSLKLDNSGRFEVSNTRADAAAHEAFRAPESRDAKNLKFTLAGECLDDALSFSDVPTTAFKHMGFEFNAEYATQFAGNQITGVSICTGINSTTRRNSITAATVYLTYDIEEEPFYSQDVTIGTNAYTFYDFTFDKPYTIEAGKAVFVMYKFQTKSRNDYYIVYDGLYHDTDEGGWCGYEVNGKVMWDNISPYYGFIPMMITITGDNLPGNGAAIWGASAPSYVVPGQTFSAQIGILGQGANAVNSVEVTTTVGSKQFVETVSLTNALEFGQRGVITVTNLSTSESGFDVPVKMEVTKVNGMANVASNPSYASSLMCFAKEAGYTRNIIVEEGTGTWCGWCPRGIVLMEALREKYTDGSVALVAVHYGDEMQVKDTEGVIATYMSSFPTALVNRSEELDFSMSNFETVYNYFRSLPAASAVTAKAEVDDQDTKVTVKGTTRFALDSKGIANRFALAFYLTEDGMGPYNQNNNYAGGRYGKLEPFDGLPSSTPVVYNDVARALNGFPGIENSVPANIVAGQEYEYSYELPLTNVTSQKFNVVAMVIDGRSGEVINTTVTPASKNSGVTSAVAADDAAVVTAARGTVSVSGATAPVAVYTTDGRCVATAAGDCTLSLGHGLYIVRTGATVVKVNL